MYKNNLLHVATVSLLFAFKNGAISDDGDIENNKTLRRIMAARRGLFLLIASWRQPWDIMGYCAWGCQCCLFHTGHILGHV